MSTSTTQNPDELRKLAEIFFPYFTARRKKIFGLQYEKKTARFAHYTSAENGLKIIQSKHLWMRNARLMVDYREVEHGHKILHDFFHNPVGEKFREALDLCVPGCADSALSGFDQHWGGIRDGTYISSISEHDESENEDGRLSMWRAFGSGPRVALIFDIPVKSEGSQALNLTFSPVAYLPDCEVHKSLLSVAENLIHEQESIAHLGLETVSKYAVEVLLMAVTCLKYPGFREEREWRAVYFPNLSRSKLMESSVQVIGGVPQTVYKIPLNGGADTVLSDLHLSRLLTRVIIGPAEQAAFIREVFVEESSQLGVSNADEHVVSSKIPIRA